MVRKENIKTRIEFNYHKFFHPTQFDAYFGMYSFSIHKSLMCVKRDSLFTFKTKFVSCLKVTNIVTYVTMYDAFIRFFIVIFHL